MKAPDVRTQNIFQFAIILCIIILVNYISSFVYFRLDLTTGNRYELKTVTQELLQSLDDVVYIEVFLHGDLPAEFERLERAIKQELDEFRVYGGNNLEYEFINPAKEGEKARKKYYQELKKRGLKPINLKHKDQSGTYSQQIIFPGAIIHYQGNEIAVNLLKQNENATSQENLNNSVESLEYELAIGLKSLTAEKVEKIAFLEGHKELKRYQVEDITRAMARFYQVDRGTIRSVKSLADYKALIIAKPREKFSKKEKLAIDQYIMRGGNVMWLLDKVKVSHDSLRRKGSTVAMARDINLRDQLFTYGVRVNPSLIKDLYCHVIPVKTSVQGAESQFTPTPWPYYPLIQPPDDHPVTKNLDLIQGEYVNTIDTLQHDPQIDKTVLLTSSRFSQSLSINAPSMIRLSEVERELKRKYFNESYLPIAVLLEGVFPSLFKNRPVQDLIADSLDYHVKSKSDSTKMMVIADGDIIRNDADVKARGTRIYPLGYDKYTRKTFGNKEFIMNAMHYLTDEEGMMELLSKDIRLRLLDQAQIRQERLKWQLINTVIPVLFVGLFGWVMHFIRKRKYAN